MLAALPGSQNPSEHFLDELTAGFSAPHPGAPAQPFVALQQHIEELTTEKFELQRGLAQQGKLAASLAAENMQLGEHYNQQVRVQGVP